MNDYQTITCKDCGKVSQNSYVSYIAEQMLERSLCYTCNHWFNFRKRNGGNTKLTIINGRIYTPGNNTSGPNRGCGGRRFDIEYIRGPYKGKRITTFDLWCGGEMPDRMKLDYPDTAKFLNGAEEVKVNEITYFNESSNFHPPYPLPKELI